MKRNGDHSVSIESDFYIKGDNVIMNGAAEKLMLLLKNEGRIGNMSDNQSRWVKTMAAITITIMMG